jgi:hypothetical protein
MWFSGFFSHFVCTYDENYRPLIFLSGRTCTIGGWLNTFFAPLYVQYIAISIALYPCTLLHIDSVLVLPVITHVIFYSRNITILFLLFIFIVYLFLVNVYLFLVTYLIFNSAGHLLSMKRDKYISIWHKIHIHFLWTVRYFLPVNGCQMTPLLTCQNHSKKRN